MNDRLFRVLALFAVFSAFLSFTFRGLIDPWRSAVTTIESHSDLRGPYFGAFDLKTGYDPYKISGDSTSSQLLRQYGLVRMKAGYSPPDLLTYVPLTYFSFPQAKQIWLLINFFLSGLSIVLLLILSGLATVPAAVLMTGYLVFNFHPILRILEAGQNGLLVLIFLCLAMISLKKRKDFLGGIFLTLAIFVKPFPVIIFAGLALNRKGRVLAGAGAAYLLGILISSVLFGPGIFLSFFQETAQRVGPETWWANQSLLAFFMRVFSNNPQSEPWLQAPALAWGLWGMSILGLLFFTTAATLKRRADSSYSGLVLNLSFWLLLGLLVSPRTIDGYCTWLLIPVTLLLWELLRAGEWRNLALLAIAYVFLAFPGVNWSKYAFAHQGPLLMLTSSQTWGMLLLYGLMLQRVLNHESTQPA